MFISSKTIVAVVATSAIYIVALLALQSHAECVDPCIPGNEEIMKPKEHGTSHTPVQSHLKWNCDWDTADRICNYNRHYAEYSGYFLSDNITFIDDVNEHRKTDKTSDASAEPNPITFYDSNTGNPLYKAPINRSWDDFLEESIKHGWPSFRDNEVNWDYVRVLPNGETVSIDGTHLVSTAH